MQILKPSGANDFELNIEGLQNILLAEDVKDKPVVVVSVAGAFRKGKSFLLGFFLRYLRNMGTADWLGDENTPLDGFSWRGGCDCDTKGIMLWDEVFMVTTPEGRQVAVLLMDTQGTFDHESTLQECIRIFGLSILTSSVQIYNISQNIQENDMEHLRLFIEYGRLAKEGTRKEPFQKLLFLVRDWGCPYQHEYGLEGGNALLKKWLRTSENQKSELKECRQHIRSCFTEMDCFLMPYPGTQAATTEEFDGRLSSIDNKFKNHLKELVPLVLAPGNLLVKRIGDEEITCGKLLQYFKACAQSFKHRVPQAKSMLKATADFQNSEATEKCLDIYITGMKKLWEEDVLYLDVAEIEKDHNWLLGVALREFDQSPKLGHEDIVNFFKEQLKKKINYWFESLARDKYTKATLARQNKTTLVNEVSGSILAFIPLVGPLILLGLAFADLVMSDSEKAKVEEMNEQRKLARALLQCHHDH